MKTTTILSAYLEAEGRRHSVFAKRTRQRDKFGTALISRIEEGDRARDTLDRIKDTIGAQVLLDAVFGDVDPVLAKVVAILAEEPQP